MMILDVFFERNETERSSERLVFKSIMSNNSDISDIISYDIIMGKSVFFENQLKAVYKPKLPTCQ
jgi:hypothetical protein